MGSYLHTKKLPIFEEHSDNQIQSLPLHFLGSSPLKTQAPKLELCFLAILLQSEFIVHLLSVHINSGNPTTHCPPMSKKELNVIESQDLMHENSSYSNQNLLI